MTMDKLTKRMELVLQSLEKQSEIVYSDLNILDQKSTNLFNFSTAVTVGLLPLILSFQEIVSGQQLFLIAIYLIVYLGIFVYWRKAVRTADYPTYPYNTQPQGDDPVFDDLIKWNFTTFYEYWFDSYVEIIKENKEHQKNKEGKIKMISAYFVLQIFTLTSLTLSFALV
jgi:hypothetical protein